MSSNEWQPMTCPRCESDMMPIKGQDRAWRCVLCCLEIWDMEEGGMPKEEYNELFGDKMHIMAASYKPYVPRQFVGLNQPGGGSSGKIKKKKQKPDLQSRYGVIEKTAEKKK